jgi:hypothetical protein
MVAEMFAGALTPKRSSPPKPAWAAGTMAPTFATFTDTTIVSFASCGTDHVDTVFSAHERFAAAVGAATTVELEVDPVVVVVVVVVVEPANARAGPITTPATMRQRARIPVGVWSPARLCRRMTLSLR